MILQILEISFIAFGLLLFFVKPKQLPVFLVFLYVIGVPFLAIFDVSKVGEVGNSSSMSIGGMEPVYRISNYLLLICIIIEIVKHPRKLLLSPKIYLSIIVLFLFLIFWIVLHSLSFKNVYAPIRELILPILMLLFIHDHGKYSYKSFLYMLYVILAIQVVAVVFNLFGIYFHEDAINSTGQDFSLVSGTFYRFNGLSNYISLIFLFFFMEYLTSKKISTFRFSLILGAVLSMIILSGSRMSAAFFFLSIVFGYFIFTKGYKKLLLTFSILFVVFVLRVLIVSTSKDNTIDADNAFSRILYGFSELFFDSDKSTTSLSLGLFLSYINSSNLFFGFGKDILNLPLELGNAIADSRLIFLLYNYGIIYVVVLCFIFYSIINRLSKGLNKINRKKILLIFLLLAILTLTEPGLFDTQLLFLTIMYSYYLKKTQMKLLKTQSEEIIDISSKSKCNIM